MRHKQKQGKKTHVKYNALSFEYIKTFLMSKKKHIKYSYRLSHMVDFLFKKKGNKINKKKRSVRHYYKYTATFNAGMY